MAKVYIDGELAYETGTGRGRSRRGGTRGQPPARQQQAVRGGAPAQAAGPRPTFANSKQVRPAGPARGQQQVLQQARRAEIPAEESNAPQPGGAVTPEAGPQPAPPTQPASPPKPPTPQPKPAPSPAPKPRPRDGGKGEDGGPAN